MRFIVLQNRHCCLVQLTSDLNYQSTSRWDYFLIPNAHISFFQLNLLYSYICWQHQYFFCDFVYIILFSLMDFLSITCLISGTLGALISTKCLFTIMKMLAAKCVPGGYVSALRDIYRVLKPVVSLTRNMSLFVIAH